MLPTVGAVRGCVEPDIIGCDQNGRLAWDSDLAVWRKGCSGEMCNQLQGGGYLHCGVYPNSKPVKLVALPVVSEKTNSAIIIVPLRHRVAWKIREFRVTALNECDIG